MSLIKIENFGPIVNGFNENNGFINIDKVMVFIGGQGSGKSTIVKLISTISWLEKALFKKMISTDDIIKDNAFQEEWCEYQSIQNYFKENTYIEYRGLYLNFIYNGGKIVINFNEDNSYQLPKITYIPAERNFLSVLDDLENVKGLPKSLQWTLDEYIRACRSQKVPIPIGINNISFEYDKEKKETFIKGDNFLNLKLTEASSGIQSVVPMINVMYYLEFFLNNTKLNSIENLSFIERERYEELIREILNIPNLSEEEKEFKKQKVIEKFLPNHLFTIIEEIEQNLYPESQKNVLFNAFERVNNRIENKLILTTHSPYTIAYLSLAIKAFMTRSKLKVNDSELLEKIEKIVPLGSLINPESVGIYQIDDKGSFCSIQNSKGLIKDNNLLNYYLEETNELFDELLDIEDL